MHVRAVLGDGFAGVGRPAHGGDDFAGLDLFADGEAGLDFAQMRVERINFNAFDDVADDDVFAVIRQRRPGAEINHRAIGGGHDGIGRLAVPVALEAADVEALVHLPAVGAHAAETAGRPRLVRRGRGKEFQFVSGFIQGVVGGGKLERRLREKAGAQSQGQRDGGKNGAANSGKNHFSMILWISFATLLRPSTS